MLFGHFIAALTSKHRTRMRSAWKRRSQRCIMGCLWIVAEKIYATFEA